MAYFSDGFKDIFLAGIGAMALTGEKAKEMVDRLIAKGELTVEQGKVINSELKHKVEAATQAVRYDVLEARMAAMSAQERAEFAAKAAEFAAKTHFENVKMPQGTACGSDEAQGAGYAQDASAQTSS